MVFYTGIKWRRDFKKVVTITSSRWVLFNVFVVQIWKLKFVDKCGDLEMVD